jgi:GAF domain-containing protein
MAKHRPCAKSEPNGSLLRRQFSGREETLLRGENTFLDLISTAAPLPAVLNRLCAAIDLQIANLVSVITLADDQEHDLLTTTECAVRFGLHAFWSASILLRNAAALGCLEMHCCVSRVPTPFELQVLARVTHLAALAIQRHNDGENFEGLSTGWTLAPRRGSQERIYLN